MNRAEEARLLFTLLNAAEEEGRLLNHHVLKQWHALKRRFDDSHCELQHPALVRLFEEIERTDVLVGTWILFRWRNAQERISRRATTRSHAHAPTDHPDSTALPPLRCK